MTDSLDQDRARQAAIVELLTAGVLPVPATDQLVTALADARHHVASYHTRREPLDDWLTAQVRRRGVFENAAVLAAIEKPEYRTSTTNLYRQLHPERLPQLEAFLRHLLT